MLNSNLSFEHSYDKRQINSIYFDNNSFGSVTESLEGTSIRKKTRIRWYGNQLKETPATLEIKKEDRTSFMERTIQKYIHNKTLCKGLE